MTTLVAYLWPALVAAAILGASFSAVFGFGRGLPSARLEVRIAAVAALGAALLIAWLQIVPGRPGLWFDIGALCASAYACGTALGGAARWLVLGQVRPSRA